MQGVVIRNTGKEAQQHAEKPPGVSFGLDTLLAPKRGGYSARGWINSKR